MPFNASIFPWTFPVNLLSEEQAAILDKICDDYPSLGRDTKIIADAAFCKNINILLTTDRNHLADKDFSLRILKILDLKIFTPKELFEYLSKRL